MYGWAAATVTAAAHGPSHPGRPSTLAEHAGAVSPDGMQRLLRTADVELEG
jgi:hypothetical protein